jgi:hypothetical protein
MEEWVKECQKLKIELRGKEGKEAIARFTGVPVECQAEARIPFTQDNFLDSLCNLLLPLIRFFFPLYFFPYLIFFRL